MSEMSVLDRTGDTKVMWDRTKPDEVAAARGMYDSLIARGYSAFEATGKKGVAGELVREFNPDTERLIMVPQLRGG